MGDPLSHVLWLLPAGVASVGVKFLRDMALSVAKLNENIAVLIARVDSHEKQLDDHEDRLRDVEGPGQLAS